MIETLFSPYEIRMLLHFHAIAEEHRDHPDRCMVYRPSVERLIALGLIEAVDPEKWHVSYRTTDKGAYYVEAGILNVPLPVFAIPERAAGIQP